MPYSSVKDAPKWVQDMGDEKAKQWIAVFNSSYADHHDEQRAFAAATAAVKKADLSGDLRVYVEISKVDDEQRMVCGYASTPSMDSQGDRVLLSAIKDALPDYMRFANIREMHQPSAVGKAVSAVVDENGLYLNAKVVDDAAWKKVKESVYNGFSIGGRVVEKVDDEIRALKLNEISLVDRPANPDAVFDVWKSETPPNTEQPEEPKTEEPAPETEPEGETTAKVVTDPLAEYSMRKNRLTFLDAELEKLNRGA